MDALHRNANALAFEVNCLVYALGTLPWLGRVQQKQNHLAHCLSHGQFEGPWELEDLSFPDLLLPAMNRELDRRSECTVRCGAACYVLCVCVHVCVCVC